MEKEANTPCTADNLTVYERKILSDKDDITDLSAKERILKIAIKKFANYGYEKTSIRALASVADVNISSISYYFRDKEGLYKAVMEIICKRLSTDLFPVIKENNKLLSEKNKNPAEVQKIVHDTFSKVVYYLINDEVSPYVSKILIREYLSPSKNFDDCYKSTLFPIHNEMATFFSKLANLDNKDERTIICSHSILGMILVFKTHREVALRRLGWKSYGEEELNKIAEVVIENVNHLVAGYKKL